jgi:uncharacterized protein (TIGR00730 family)
MNKKEVVKAYHNTDFLNSPQARTIRIISEFLEPMTRFRRANIRDTIVVFGSARVQDPKEIKKTLNHLLLISKNKKKLTLSLKRKIEEAQIDLSMSHYYEDASRLTQLLTKWSLQMAGGQRFVVCSGGGPGIMEAANKGAAMAGGKSIGLNISLPLEQHNNKFVTKDLAFEFHYFFMRKFWFIYLAKGLVMFPGGFGTLDELMEVLTLVQTKKVKKTLPIVLYGTRYWKELINFDLLVKNHMIAKKDLSLFRFADSPEEAFQYLKQRLTKHSDI